MLRSGPLRLDPLRSRSAPGMFGAKSRQPRLARPVKIRAMTDVRRRGVFTKRLAAKDRPIPNASPVRQADRTEALRRIADHVRRARLLAIADLALKATGARVRRDRASPVIVLAQRRAKPFATPRWRRDQAAPARVVRQAEAAA